MAYSAHSSASTRTAAQALDWPRLLELTAAEARSQGGRESVLAWNDDGTWARDVAAARQRQAETAEVHSLLAKDSLWGSISGLENPQLALENLGKGSVLDLTELALLRRWLAAAAEWRGVSLDSPAIPRFRAAIESLPDLSSPHRALERILTPTGELAETASPKLASLYAEIRALKVEIGASLDQVLRRLSQKGVLQDSFSDVRDGRYVIPVRISHQGEVEGTLFEASASKQTVFIEPREVSPLNNRLRQRQNELIEEIFRILSEVSNLLRPFGGKIHQAVTTLIYWDAVQARAQIGRRYGGQSIDVTDTRSFRLARTAHPLLWWSLAPETIIPNDIAFGEPARSLLLTGPNTGGKTVLLKTLGLAGICARTGFSFPGAERPEVPFFEGFFADLGDPQSIERHLSSFSGHVMRFKEIIENVTSACLVLVDELNSATDPEEGAALGRAFLETVMERGAMIVTTTHDPNLKAAALANPAILSASMAFDESARTPTYRMVLGVPGRSRALETAERLGIPAAVVARARAYLTEGHNQLEDLLARLERDAKVATEARLEAEAYRAEAERVRRDWIEKSRTSLGEILERTRYRLRKLLDQGQDEIRQALQKLEAARSRKDLDDARRSLSEVARKTGDAMDEAMREEAPEIELRDPARPAATAGALVVGAAVRVPKWKANGTLLEIRGDQVRVAMGKIQMTVALSEVEPLAGAGGAPVTPKRPTRAAIRTGDSDERPETELDLRGKRLEEAMSELESFVDYAYRSGAIGVTVIHGLGTGALREGTRKLLTRLPYVSNFQDGGAGRGGSGATIVEFERR